MAITAGGHGGRSWLALGGLAMCALGGRSHAVPMRVHRSQQARPSPVRNRPGGRVAGADTFESDVMRSLWRSRRGSLRWMAVRMVFERTAAQDACVRNVTALELMQGLQRLRLRLGGEDLRDDSPDTTNPCA